MKDLTDNVHPDVVFASDQRDALAAAESLPQGHWRAYLPENSARGIVLTRNESGYGVSLLACSNEVDYEIAIEFVFVLASLPESMIKPEDGPSTSWAQLQEDYGPKWAQRKSCQDVHLAMQMVEERGDMLLHGCERPYLLSRDRINELRALGSEEDLPQRLLQDIAHVQHVGGDDLYNANLMQATDDNGNTRTVAIIGPGVDYFLPAADVFTLYAEPPFEISASVLERQAAGKIERVGGAQFVLTAIDDAEWADFVSRCANDMKP